MAVFGTSASNDFKAKISSANEAVLILGSENHLQFNLEKNMDQIRSTIMQQEALFREQVQALHKLYDVQKSAMQEIKKSIFSPAQKWVYNYESVTIGDNSLCGSILVVKPLRPASANAESYKEESLALSLHPFCALREVQSCDSLCMNSHGANTSYSSQSKPTRNFDLEKLPEDNVDESQNEVKSNSSKMPDINSTLTKRTLDRDANRFLGADLSVKMDSPSPTQVYPEPDFRTPSSPSHKINQDCDQALGGNVCGVDEKCATGSQNLNNNEASQDFPQNNVVSNPSTCMDGPKTFHQGSLVFTSQNFSPAEVENFHGERIPEQARGSITPGLIQLYQCVEQNGLTKATHPKLEGQQNGYVGVRLLAKDPANCSKGSLNSGTLQARPINLNDLLIEMAVSSEKNSVSQKQHSHSCGFNSQISASGKNENLNDSGNRIIFQDLKSDEVKSISICTKSNSASRDHSDNCREPGSPGLTIHGREAIQSNEVPQFIKDGKEPSPSSTIFDSVTKHIDSYSSKEDKSYANSEEPVVTESSKKLKDKSDLDEAYDNIAADILLSFTSDKAQANYKSTGTWIGTVSGRSGKGNSSPDKKWKLRGRKHASYSKYGSVNESVEWTQFVKRGRTSRRPQ